MGRPSSRQRAFDILVLAVKSALIPSLLTLSACVTDSSSNPASTDTTGTTGSTLDTTAPTVGTTLPLTNAVDVALDSKITVTFSETIDASNIPLTSVVVRDAASNVVAGTVAASGKTLTFTPATALNNDTTYTTLIAASIRDAAGNTLAGAYSWDFTTTSNRAPLSLLAGDVGGSGSTDGTGAAARFLNLDSVATDRAGNAFVVDSRYGSGSTVRKITPAGIVTTIAGRAGYTGSIDGIGADARFSELAGIAVDSSDNIYVTASNDNTIRKITAAGVVSTFAGAVGVAGSDDGTGTLARFSYPQGIATDSDGNVYVADRGNSTIRKITPAGVVTTLAGTAGAQGDADGTGAAALFTYPDDVATDSTGNVYVAANGAIRRITAAGVVSTVTSAAYVQEAGITADAQGNVYISVRYQDVILKIKPNGDISTLAGLARTGFGFAIGSADGTGVAARFDHPSDVAIDLDGNLFVTDDGSSLLRRVTSAGVVTTLAGSVGHGGDADGMGTLARFSGPSGIATDSTGNIFVADYASIRKITASGIVSTLAGTSGALANTSGSLANGGLAIDADHNIYFAGSGTVRRFEPSGAVMTIAGSAGTTGSSDGIGSAASFRTARGLATDQNGNVYVAELDAIRKITPARLVSTFAGTPGTAGNADGIGSAATFTTIGGIATDSVGNLYVTDNSTVRKITPDGSVSTLAGTAGTNGIADGTGSSAQFNVLAGIVVDASGNIYVADGEPRPFEGGDFGSQTIRKITPAGAVTTVIGVARQEDFTPGALPGNLTQPRGLAINGNKLYITLANGVAVVQTLP